MAFVNRELLDTVFRQLSNQFRGGFQNGEDPINPLLSTRVPASTASVRFDALYDSAQMRKWTAERTLNKMRNFNYEVSVEDYEYTIEVDRNDVDDDTIGLYSVSAYNGGEAARLLVPRKIAETLDAGDSNLCYDGQNFFDTDHPVGEDGDLTTASNLLNDGGANASTPWYLADLSRSLKPVLVVERKAPDFQQPANSMDDMYTFMNKKYVMGADARYGFGYGMWQYIIRNEGALNYANLKATDLAMRDFRLDKKDEAGRRPKMGLNPTHIIVSSANSYAARMLVGPEMIKAGSDPEASDDNVLMPNPFRNLQILEVSWLP